MKMKMTKFSDTSNAGTSSGKAYSNKTGQETSGVLGVPLGEELSIQHSTSTKFNYPTLYCILG